MLFRSAPASFALTAVNSPTFTTDRGYAGNGSSSYLNTGWDAGTNGVNVVQDAVAYGVYINSGTDTATNSPVQMGEYSTPNMGFNMIARGVGDVFRGRTNCAAVNFSGTVTTRMGFTMFDRSTSSLVTGYRNGSSVGTHTTASYAPSTDDIYICAGNNSGPANYSDNRIALSLVGGSLTAAQHAALHQITQSYLMPIGAA